MALDVKQIEIDINDWRLKNHLPDALLERYLEGGLWTKAAEAFESHLLICPCCQEQLIEITLRKDARVPSSLCRAAAA